MGPSVCVYFCKQDKRIGRQRRYTRTSCRWRFHASRSFLCCCCCDCCKKWVVENKRKSVKSVGETPFSVSPAYGGSQRGTGGSLILQSRRRKLTCCRTWSCMPRCGSFTDTSQPEKSGGNQHTICAVEQKQNRTKQRDTKKPPATLYSGSTPIPSMENLLTPRT